jgi:hypothetical protein
MKKITANLIVDSVEEALAFWVDRLGFSKTVEVPQGERLGFVILTRGKTELMLQSQTSLRNDVPAAAEGPHHTVLYLEVDDLAPIRKALGDWPLLVPERTTFYGARELIVNAPGNHTIFIAAHA